MLPQEGMEKSRNGKQTSDFADSPDAVGLFLLQSKRAEAVGRFWGLSFGFSGQKSGRCCTTEYLFPNPSHLLSSFKAYQNNLKMTSFLLHLQVLGMGIPAHLAVSTSSLSLLTALCSQAVVQDVFAPLHPLSYMAAAWTRFILPLLSPPVFLQQVLPYSPPAYAKPLVGMEKPYTHGVLQSRPQLERDWKRNSNCRGCSTIKVLKYEFVRNLMDCQENPVSIFFSFSSLIQTWINSGKSCGPH